MFGTLEFNYKGHNGRWYHKENTTAAEIRRIYKRVRPTSFIVWFDTDAGFVVYSNLINQISLQARSINYIGNIAERYNGVTKIGYYIHEYTNC